jgi:MFS superfamily sulfate permease-like transporter
MWRSSRVDFINAIAALIGVLLLGILHGILLAALISILLLLALSSTPHVAFLGRIPGTTQYSDIERHAENEPLDGVLAFRPEGSLLYLNAEYVLNRVMARLDQPAAESVRKVVCDLSACPRVDLSGARMLVELDRSLSQRGLGLTVVSAHGTIRDLLRAEGVDREIEGIARGTTLGDLLERCGAGSGTPRHIT